MLNFRTTSLIFLLSVILFGFLHYFSGISLWWFLLPLIIYKAIIIYGSANIRSDFYLKAYCSSITNEKIIALTFDDGPNQQYTPEILKVLEEFKVPATFFLIGKNIQGNENIVNQIDLAGHTIGNHTFSHSFFIDFKSKKGFIAELNQSMEMVYKLTGKRMKLFRPPYGVTTPNLANAVKALNYNVIGWNIRSLDTKADSEETITKRVTSQMKPGAIILFHDTSVKTRNVLIQTLSFAKENGFKIVSVEQLLEIKAYEG